MQAPIPIMSPSLMQWMKLMIKLFIQSSLLYRYSSLLLIHSCIVTTNMTTIVLHCMYVQSIAEC